MMDLLETIKSRRSVRQFESREVPAEMVVQILEAVRWAPSWTNCQCWDVVVIRDAAIKEKLQASFPPKGNPAVKGHCPGTGAAGAVCQDRGFWIL